MAPTASGSAQETAPLLSSHGPTPASSSAGPSKTDTYQSIPTYSSPAPAAGDYGSDSEEGYTAAALLAAESERKDSSSTWKWLAFVRPSFSPSFVQVLILVGSGWCLVCLWGCCSCRL